MLWHACTAVDPESRIIQSSRAPCFGALNRVTGGCAGYGRAIRNSDHPQLNFQVSRQMNGSRQLYECVPNWSEGRDLGLVRELSAVATAAGVHVADVTSDADHHRTVMTWFGTQQQIEQALTTGLEAFSQHLKRNRGSLDEQRGIHPRTGLLDVVPIVPLDSFEETVAVPQLSTMKSAVAVAQSVAARLAQTCLTPIYLYEHAASATERRNLAAHRRALLNPEPIPWPSDVGPSAPHPRHGVVLVGARRPLVAFNLDLATDDQRTAQRIAATIRATKPGGLAGVKALGLKLERRRCAQVSVNLVDARVTDLATLVERVQYEARAAGTQVRACELIGLATRVAIGKAVPSDLLLPDLGADRCVEFHLKRYC